MNKRQWKKLIKQVTMLNLFLFTNNRKHRLVSKKRTLWFWKRIMAGAKKESLTFRYEC